MDRGTIRRAAGGVPARALFLVLLLCALTWVARGAEAQSQPPAPIPQPTARDHRASRDDEVKWPNLAVVLAKREVLRGSVSAVAAEAKQSGSELRVPLAASGVPELTSKFRVVTGRGRVELVASKPVVALPQRGTSVLSSSDAPKIAAGSRLRIGEKTPLPWMVVDTKPARTAAEPAQVRTARPYLGLARAIRWDPATSSHVAQFQLGIDAEAGGTGELEEPVVASLSVSCDDVSPARVTLDQIGPAGEKVIQVSCSRAALKDPETQSLKVRLADAELAYSFSIPHTLGEPLVSSVATRVAGFGIGSVEIIVKNVEVDGTPAPVAADTTVRLLAQGASIDPSELTIAAGKTDASVEVHARSIGRVRLTADNGALRSQPWVIDFGFPLAFLITTLLGGAAGGYLSSIRAKAKAPRRRVKRVQSIIEGAIVGMLVVVAVLVFPSVAAIPGWARASVVGWLLTSALAGFVGSDLIDRLATRMFGKRDVETSDQLAS